MKRTTIKKILPISIALCIFVQLAVAQKTEINFNAFSGLFFFRGDGTALNSMINVNMLSSLGKFTSNIYGKKSGFSYVAEIQGQRITRQKNIIGLGLGFETLTSRVNIDTVYENGFIYHLYPANGKTILKNTFITLNPFVGHRYIFGNVSFDVLAGADLAFCLKSKEVGNALTSNKYYIAVNNSRMKPLLDFRPRIQIKAGYNRFGFLAGYSLGLTNYDKKNNTKAYSNFLRLGLSYQINNF